MVSFACAARPAAHNPDTGRHVVSWEEMADRIIQGVARGADYADEHLARLYAASPDAMYFDIDEYEALDTKEKLARALFTAAQLDSPLAELGETPLDLGADWYRVYVDGFERERVDSVYVKAFSEIDAMDKAETLLFGLASANGWEDADRGVTMAERLEGHPDVELPDRPAWPYCPRPWAILC